MSVQTFRLPLGGRIDRSKPLAFTFNGRAYQGYAGDTLASALLANGVRVVARSFKYHRPRGIVSAGPEEPNALVRVGRGAYALPNLPATMVELYDGLEAESINCWPGVGFDLGAAASLVSRMLPAGFYYKTFMWPHGAWMWYERFIRNAAGLGRTPAAPAVVESPRPTGDRRRRRQRAIAGVRQQRFAGRDAGKRRASLCRAIRRARGFARGGLYQQ